MQNIELSLLNEQDFPKIERVAKALASPLRLNIIRQLHERPMTVIELAKTNNITNSTAIFHLNLLQEAGIIKVRYLPSKKGSAQVFFIQALNYITFFRKTGKDMSKITTFEQSVKVGAYTHTENNYLGMAVGNTFFSDLHPFDEKRMDANLIWSFGGDLTYTFSNEFATKKNAISKLDFSFEICSETTCFRNDWKSDIFIAVNGVEIAHYLSPGDFGGTKGKYTPDWWPANMTQFGNLVMLSITEEGTFLNNKPASSFTLKDLRLSEERGVKLRIYNKPDSTYYGGMNLFGKGSGNYNQDIVMTAYYSTPKTEEE